MVPDIVFIYNKRVLANGGYNVNVSDHRGDFRMHLLMKSLLLKFETATYGKVLVEEGDMTKLENRYHVFYIQHENRYI